MGDEVAKLPAYVYQDKDRHGKLRLRCRKKGLPSRTINASPTSKEFRDAYSAWLGNEIIVPAHKDSLEWLVGEYLHHLENMVKAGRAKQATLKQRKLQLTQLCSEHGDRNAFEIKPRSIRMIVGRLAATPAKANNVLKSIRAMYKWAVLCNMIDENPSTGVESLQYKTDGFKPWTMAELRQFVHKHPLGTRAYLAAILTLCTGARRGDIPNIGPRSISTIDGVKCISFVQEKTGTEVTIPILPILQESIDQIKVINALTFIPNGYGKPYTKESLGNWFHKKVIAAEIVERSLHGLRKAQGSILAEMGCTQYEIMAVQGHADPKSSEIYTRAANRIKLSLAAMDKVSGFKI